jgi:hypothetical protein
MFACVAAFCGFSASAATVFPNSGDVFVNRGNGFQKINGATVVKVGDSVMVSPDGLAQVRLEDGNVITVSPGQVLSVPAKARPKDAALPDSAHATQADACCPPVAAVTTCNPCTDGFGLLAAGALAAAGVAGAAALAESGPPPLPQPFSPQ